MPLRVAFDARDALDPRRRGWGRYASDLLDALRRNGDVAVCAHAGGGRLPEIAWEQAGWPARLVGSGADVLHAPNCFLPLVRPCPGVVTVHDLAFEEHPDDFSPRTGWKYRTFTPRAVRSAQAVICVSRATADDVQERYGAPAERIHVVPNAPSLGTADDATGRGTAGPEPQGDPVGVRGPEGGGEAGDDRPYLLAIGDLRAKKNLTRLVEAWRRSGLEHRLVLVGTPTGTADVEPLVRAGAEVRGWVPEAELDRLLRGAALLVHPSLFEGFGLVLLEAMARGVPVACSAIPSLSETAGGAAELFDPRDVDDVARGLHDALRDAGRLAQAGRARASTFDWDRTARETIDVYRQAAS